MSSPPASQLGDDGLGDDANASSSGASSAGPGAPWVPPGRKSVLVPLVGTDHNGNSKDRGPITDRLSKKGAF